MGKRGKGRTSHTWRVTQETAHPPVEGHVQSAIYKSRKAEIEAHVREKEEKLTKPLKNPENNVTSDLEKIVETTLERIEEAKRLVLDLAKSNPGIHIREKEEFDEIRTLAVELSEIKEIETLADADETNRKLAILFRLIKKLKGRLDRVKKKETGEAYSGYIEHKDEGAAEQETNTPVEEVEEEGSKPPAVEVEGTGGKIVRRNRKKPEVLDPAIEAMRETIQEKCAVLRAEYKKVNGLLRKKGRVTQDQWREVLDELNEELKSIERFTQWHRKRPVARLPERLSAIETELQRIYTQLI